MFFIDELSGEIRALASFDYESTQTFFLTIEARDNSSSPLAATASFYVNITDRNDNTPTFDSFPADRSFIESTPTGTEIATASASDKDSGDNGDVSGTCNLNFVILFLLTLQQISYQLSNDEGKFEISSTGVITLINSLDREITDQYNLTVIAFDRGQPQMSAIGYLLITVEDENDVTPTFLRVSKQC